MTKFKELTELNQQFQRLQVLRKYSSMEEKEYQDRVMTLKKRLKEIRER